MKNLKLFVVFTVFLTSLAGLALARSGTQDVQAMQDGREDQRVEGSWYVTVQVTGLARRRSTCSTRLTWEGDLPALMGETTRGSGDLEARRGRGNYL